MKDELLNATCRLAFAAYVHDLGKFAERARIPEAEEKDTDGNTRAELNKQLYCPQWDGRPTHVHAAYTAIAIDLIESALPPLKGQDVSPFASWKGKDTDDSLINAAARHHRPETALQWIIATADRLASGFEREQFDNYNRSEDTERAGQNHYTTRLLTLFEQIRLDDESSPAPRHRHQLKFRYPLRPLSVQSLFPVPASEAETADRQQAREEYAALWKQFIQDLENIPASHRKNWSLWLDHFDSLWATYTSAIPSATAGSVKPDVSLYDHSRTTAALAAALWRFHREDDPQTVREQLRAQWDTERQHQDLARKAWTEKKFLLIMGDFFGIQPFILASGGETGKNAAKLLRGRSAQVALLTECAALRVLEELALPPTSQVINAAGRFLIVAPNTEDVRQQLEQLQKTLDAWFLEHTFGRTGIGLAWIPAAAGDFVTGDETSEPPFRKLLDTLFRTLETAKRRRFNLCCQDAPSPVFSDALERYYRGACPVDGQLPAEETTLPHQPDIHISRLARDQIDLGTWLTRHTRILITREPINHHSLALSYFGFHISFTGPEAASGRFGELAANGSLRRAWDFELPVTEQQDLFNGYARRHINAHVPRLTEEDLNNPRYEGIETDAKPGDPKTFEHIARDDLWMATEEHGWHGTEALMTLKGDVDNLGRIFEKGMERPTFARWAALSRQINAFFTTWLPWHCREHAPNIYTVFAGGDDFFMIGPWHSTIKLARSMREKFHDYVAENGTLHFSVGLSMTKPGLSIRTLGSMGEEALDKAKSYPGKNALTLFDQTISWADFDGLWTVYENLMISSARYGLSTRYLYRLQQLADMQEALLHAPQNAIWHAWWHYRTTRLLEKLDPKEREQALAEMAKVIHEPITLYGSRFKIPLFIQLYQQRSKRS